jgi:hypothetical protein
MAPKAIMFANFITPAALPIVPLGAPANLSVVAPTWIHYGSERARPIRLEPWQELLVKQATEEFIRGLIDSDGCRVVANDRGVRSVRYHFSNRSEDILGLFSGALDALGIPWSPADTVSPYTARQRWRVSTSSSVPSLERRRGTVVRCPLHVVAGPR